VKLGRISEEEGPKQDAKFEGRDRTTRNGRGEEAARALY